MTGSSCDYEFENGQRCQRIKDDGDHYCIFHSFNCNSEEEIKRFWWRLKRLELKGDGDWRGFRFPSVNLENVTCKTSVTLTKAAFEGQVSLKQCKFEKAVVASQIFSQSSFELSGCEFSESLNVSNSSFPNVFNLSSVRISKELTATNCTFKGDFFATGKIKGLANFAYSSFAKKAEFKAMKSITVSFNSPIRIRSRVGNVNVRLSRPDASLVSRFKDWLVNLRGKLIYQCELLHRLVREWVQDSWYNLKFLGRKYYQLVRERFPHERKDVERHVLFEGGANLTYVEFSEPEKVLFKGVNLRETSFVGAELKGVSFIGSYWYQNKLKRSGIADEISYFSVKNYYDKKELLPGLESTYRDIRFSLEENKDFGMANHFFIGEMDAKRRQLPFFKRKLFSIPALYKLVSNYGTNPLRCSILFFVAVFCHALLVSYFAESSFYSNIELLVNSVFNINFEKPSVWWGGVIESAMSTVNNADSLKSITYSIQTMTLQKDKVALLTPDLMKLSSISFTNTVFTIIGPILVGLLALTVRTRIKRN